MSPDMSGVTAKPRPVSRATRTVADVVRVAVLGGVVTAAISDEIEGAIRLTVVLHILLAARLAGIPGPFDLAVSLLLPLASVASILHWYAQLSWLDWIVHCLTTGALAAMAFLVLARVRLLPRPHALSSTATVSVTAMLGVTLGVLWEFYEWFAEVVAHVRIGVGYNDTIADLSMDLTGSLLAGLAILAWGKAKQDVYRHTVAGDE